MVFPAHARENWASEISIYTGQENAVSLIANQRALYSKLEREARYTLIAYTTLAKEGVAEACIKAGFDGFIWDECQYGKNAAGQNPAKRAEACSKLIHEIPLKRIVALSATPWENHPREIAAVAAALRPEVFPSAENFRQSGLDDARLLREVLGSRGVDVELREVEDLPPVDPKPWEDLFGVELIDPTPWHRAMYLHLREKDENRTVSTEKVRRLLLATTHPHAVKTVCSWPSDLEQGFDNLMFSTKLGWLKRVLTQELKTGAKVVIGTGIWVEGITRVSDEEKQMVMVADVLREWFGKDSMLVLDGNVSQAIRNGKKSLRRQLIEEWRQEASKRILLVSIRACPDSVNLSVPKLPGIIKLFVTALSYPWVPWKQFLGRFLRKGQGVPVHYKVPVLKGTICESLWHLLERKWEAQKLFRALVPLTDEELKRFDHSADVKFLTDEARSAMQRVNLINSRMRGQGESGALAVLGESYGGSTNSHVFAEAFLETQEHGASGHISRCMQKVICKLRDEGLIHPEKILDAGCGPVTLERRLGWPVYGIDLNHRMIELGRSHSSHGAIHAQQGFLSRLPKEWQGKVEVTVASLVLDWSRITLKEGERQFPERLRILAELVRVTNPQGQVWIAATRESMNEEVLQSWTTGLKSLGFSMVEHLTGLVRATDAREGSKFSFWSICFSPNGKVFLPRNHEAYAFLFEKRGSKVVRGSNGRKVPLIEQRKVIHQEFEVVEAAGMTRRIEDAAVKVVQSEVSRLATASDVGGRKLYRQPSGLDWRVLAKLHERGLLSPSEYGVVA